MEERLSTSAELETETPRRVTRLLHLYILLHVLMIVWEFFHRDIWITADRANERIIQLIEFSRLGVGSAMLDYIGRHNVPGDYLFQAILFDIGGRWLLVTVQVALSILSVICVYRIASRTLASSKLAVTAATLYALLPQTLIFPHQLSAEAWFVPFTLFGFYYMTEWMIGRNQAASWKSGFSWALATLSRPTTLPFAVLPPLAAARSSSRREVCSYFLALLIPVGAWLLMVHAYTGQWSFGVHTSATLGGNLRQRAEYIIDTFGPDARDAALERYIEPIRLRNAKMTIAEYWGFCSAYPGPCAVHTAQDMFNYFLKSGVERITVDYLGLIPQAERREVQAARPGSELGWAQVLRNRGTLFALNLYIGKYPLVMGISVVAALAFGILTLLFLVGSAQALLSLKLLAADNRRLMLALLAAFPFCLFVTSSVVASMQSRHRAAAEFAFCILAVHGWRVARQVRSPATSHASSTA